MGFDPTWLRTRARFDALARDPELLPALFEGLGEPDGLTLIDVGAGLGAGARFCIPEIPAAQRWWLFDRDPALLGASLPATAEWACARGWRAEMRDGALFITGAEYPIEIRTICGELSELAERVDLGAVDVVTANALFDLLSVEDFARFAAALKDGGTALLATLNYAAMRFMPPRPDDGAMIRRYEAHMTRPRPGGGASMGPSCGPEMRAELSAAGFRVRGGRSVWAIPPTERVMMELMFGFMSGALPEMAGTFAERVEIDAWIDVRNADLVRGTAGLVIEHEDLLALPV